MAGSYAGAGMAMARGVRFIRPIFLTAVIAVLLRLGWRQLA